MKPDRYTIEVTVRPQGGDIDGMEMTVKFEDIERAAILKPDWCRDGMRATVKTAEYMMGLETEDFA